MRHKIIRYLGQKSKNMHINGHRLTSMRMLALPKHTYTTVTVHQGLWIALLLLDVAGMSSSYFHWMTLWACSPTFPPRSKNVDLELLSNQLSTGISVCEVSECHQCTRIRPTLYPAS